MQAASPIKSGISELFPKERESAAMCILLFIRGQTLERWWEVALFQVFCFVFFKSHRIFSELGETYALKTERSMGHKLREN